MADRFIADEHIALAVEILLFPRHEYETFDQLVEMRLTLFGLRVGLRGFLVCWFDVEVFGFGRQLAQAGHGDWPGHGYACTAVDCETGEERELCLTPALMARYREAFAQFSEEIHRAARQVGARCLTVDLSQSFDDVVMKVFRTGGFLG